MGNPYTFQFPENVKVAKAFSWNLPISRKHSIEIARMVRYLPVKLAKEWLRKVIEKEMAVPFFTYNRDIPHRKTNQIHPYFKVKFGRFPEKASRYILKVIESAEKNAINLGMNPEKLFIIHIAGHKGTTAYKIKRRWRVRRKLTHVEVILGEHPLYNPNQKYSVKELKKMGKQLLHALLKGETLVENQQDQAQKAEAKATA